MLYCLCRLLCSCDYAEWLFELRRAPILQTPRLQGAKGIVKLWKAPGRFRRRCFLLFFFYFLTFILHAEEVLPWKRLEASGLSLIVLGSLCKILKKKTTPFSFKMELKMCWFCLYWTLFLNFLGFDHSVCAKPPKQQTLESRNLANMQLQRRWQ